MYPARERARGSRTHAGSTVRPAAASPRAWCQPPSTASVRAVSGCSSWSRRCWIASARSQQGPVAAVSRCWISSPARLVRARAVRTSSGPWCCSHSGQHRLRQRPQHAPDVGAGGSRSTLASNQSVTAFGSERRPWSRASASARHRGAVDLAPARRPRRAHARTRRRERGLEPRRLAARCRTQPAASAGAGKRTHRLAGAVVARQHQLPPQQCRHCGRRSVDRGQRLDPRTRVRR